MEFCYQNLLNLRFRRLEVEEERMNEVKKEKFHNEVTINFIIPLNPSVENSLYI